MRMQFKLILILVAWLLTQEAIAHWEYDWHLVRDEDDIQVYLKKIHLDDIKSFKGVAHIQASVDSLLAVITDIEACSEWLYHCIKPALLLRKGFSETYHYQVHRLPFPASNREFIFHSKITHTPETGAVLIRIQAVPEFCTYAIKTCTRVADQSLVRVNHSHGHYLLEPLDKKTTRVTWIQHTNPGGSLPTWLINQLIREMPFRTLQNLRKKVTEKKYQRARLIVNSQGKITALKLHR